MLVKEYSTLGPFLSLSLYFSRQTHILSPVVTLFLLPPKERRRWEWRNKKDINGLNSTPNLLAVHKIIWSVTSLYRLSLLLSPYSPLPSLLLSISLFSLSNSSSNDLWLFPSQSMIFFHYLGCFWSGYLVGFSLFTLSRTLYSVQRMAKYGQHGESIKRE